MLPLAGVGRRVHPSSRLQLLILAQAACYAVAACHYEPPAGTAARGIGAKAGIAWQLLPGVYAPVG
jgi:hypothetical protein